MQQLVSDLPQKYLLEAAARNNWAPAFERMAFSQAIWAKASPKRQLVSKSHHAYKVAIVSFQHCPPQETFPPRKDMERLHWALPCMESLWHLSSAGPSFTQLRLCGKDVFASQTSSASEALLRCFAVENLIAFGKPSHGIASTEPVSSKRRSESSKQTSSWACRQLKCQRNQQTQQISTATHCIWWWSLYHLYPPKPLLERDRLTCDIS